MFHQWNNVLKAAESYRSQSSKKRNPASKSRLVHRDGRIRRSRTVWGHLSITQLKAPDNSYRLAFDGTDYGLHKMSEPVALSRTEVETHLNRIQCFQGFSLHRFDRKSIKVVQNHGLQLNNMTHATRNRRRRERRLKNDAQKDIRDALQRNGACMKMKHRQVQKHLINTSPESTSTECWPNHKNGAIAPIPPTTAESIRPLNASQLENYSPSGSSSTRPPETPLSYQHSNRFNVTLHLAPMHECGNMTSYIEPGHDDDNDGDDDGTGPSIRCEDGLIIRSLLESNKIIGTGIVSSRASFLLAKRIS
ncbi:hypothetical protein B0O80DRAFT_254745 [Mortierella sp. GBAus27b]|nr:hypothetical protein B0O80DRAFT_254745 [Mortierella sp. GBAus27b]